MSNRNPALSNDRVVITISTLAAMLEENTACLAATERAAAVAVDLGASLQEQCDNLERDLENTRRELRYAQEDKEEIRRALSREQQRSAPSSEQWAANSRAQLLATVMQDPERFMRGITFLRSDEAQPMIRGNEKIALIKRVREATHYGLKEAKDLVEAFFAFPSSTPVLCAEAGCQTPSHQPSAE